MPDEETRNSSGEQTSSSNRGSRAGDSSLGSAGAVQDRMKKGLGAYQPKTSTGMPKQLPGEDVAKFSARMRKWREAKDEEPELVGQKRALARMASGK